MAVLKKIRSRFWSPTPNRPVDEVEGFDTFGPSPTSVVHYDLRPLTVSQLDETWRLDQRCFVDGEAYTRDTFEYLLTAPEAVAYRAVTNSGVMTGFVIGVMEPDRTGHVTTIGVGPEHRRRGLASRLMKKIEDGFHRRGARIVRLEVRAINVPAQQLYIELGYTVTQRLPSYYSNGGDGLLMVRAID